MKKMTKSGVWGVACCLGLVVGLFVVVGMVAPAKAATLFTIDTVDGDWANAVTVPAAGATIANSSGTNATSTVRWGTTSGQQSGYDYASPVPPVAADSMGTPFAIGDFTHLNFPIGTPFLTNVDLKLDVQQTLGANAFAITHTFAMTHLETSNIGAGCCPAVVTILNPTANVSFFVGVDEHFFNLLGFSQDAGATFTTMFNTAEKASNVATLYATITHKHVSVPEPATMLLMGIGMAGLMGSRIRNAGKKQ